MQIQAINNQNFGRCCTPKNIKNVQKAVAEDMGNGINNYTESKAATLVTGISSALGIIGFGIMCLFNHGQHKADTPLKPAIENIDSTMMNKMAAKDTAVFTDTMKVLSKIKK